MRTMETLIEIERQALIADTTAKAREVYGRDPYLARSPTASASMDLQYRISDRAVRCHTDYNALAVIGRLGVTFSAEDAEHAVEQLGLIMAHAAVIATMEDLGVEPIIALGRELTKRQDVQPMRAAAVLATAANLFGVGREPRQLALVDGLALAIAKALDDCEIGHGLTIEPLELYRHIGAEVIAGKLSMQTVGEPHGKPREAAPGVSTAALPPSPSARRTEAFANLQAAADDLMEPACERVIEVPIGYRSDEFEQRRCGKRPALSGFCAEHTQTREEPTARHRRPTTDAAGTPITEEHLDGRRPYAQLVVHTPRESILGPCSVCGRPTGGCCTVAELDAMPLHSDNLHYRLPDEEFHARPPRQGPPPGVPRGEDIGIVKCKTYEQRIPPATAEEQRLGVSAETVCPQCAAPMTVVHGNDVVPCDLDIHRCENGHEHTSQHLAALRADRLAAANETVLPPGQAPARPAPVTRGGRHFPPPRKS